MARRLDHPVDITHHGSTMNYGPRFDQLHRRELITLLGGATARGPLDVSQFESDHPGKLNSTAVMLRVWQYLAAAAYSSSHSSNAKSLCGAFSADSPKIEAATRPDFAPDAFRSSSPPSPATQSVSTSRNRYGISALWPKPFTACPTMSLSGHEFAQALCLSRGPSLLPHPHLSCNSVAAALPAMRANNHPTNRIR